MHVLYVYVGISAFLKVCVNTIVRLPVFSNTSTCFAPVCWYKCMFACICGKGCKFKYINDNEFLNDRMSNDCSYGCRSVWVRVQF